MGIVEDFLTHRGIVGWTPGVVWSLMRTSILGGRSETGFEWFWLWGVVAT